MKEACGSCGECMHGRGIICKHPVARITGTLTLTSALRTALKRGPSAILFNGLHTHIVQQKCYKRVIWLHKHHVGDGIAHFYAIKKIFTSFWPHIPGY